MTADDVVSATFDPEVVVAWDGSNPMRQRAGTQTDDGAGQAPAPTDDGAAPTGETSAPAAAPSSPDAAHVAAVAEVLDDADGRGCCCLECGEALATVAVETLTPLIRAQVAAEIRARADADGDWIGQTDPDSILRMAARIAEATP